MGICVFVSRQYEMPTSLNAPAYAYDRSRAPATVSRRGLYVPSNRLPFRKLQLGQCTCVVQYNTLKFELKGATRGKRALSHPQYRHTFLPRSISVCDL